MGHSPKIQGCILKHSFAAAAIGVPGAFVAHGDVPVLIGIWAKMIYNLSQHSGKNLDWNECGKIACCIGAAAGAFVVSGKIANSGLAVSGVGTPLAIIFNSSINGIFTYTIGDTSANVFAKKDLTAGDYLKAILGGLSLGLSDTIAQKAGEFFDNWFSNNPKPS